MLLKALVLGIVQGLTEFLPVSSTAHLVLIEQLFSWNMGGLSFDVAVHMGTLLALLVFFKDQWYSLGKGFAAGCRVRPAKWNFETRLAWLIIIATIPAVIAAPLLGDLVEEYLRTPSWVAVLLVAGTIPMLAAEFFGRKSRGFIDLKYRDSVTVGLAQVLALGPGVSRSGITISAGMLGGLEREAAARFAFLLSAPVIAGAGIWEGVKLVKGGFPADLIGPFCVGFAASAITGFLTVKFLLRYLSKGTLYPFVVYRIIMAVIVLVVIRIV